MPLDVKNQEGTLWWLLQKTTLNFSGGSGSTMKNITLSPAPACACFTCCLFTAQLVLNY